jgi:predicted TIM-barrel fold metal-dependent hydrolase
MNLTDFPLFDAHFHIIDPNYPLVENQGFMPSHYTCEEYRQQTASLPLIGGVVVSGSYQAYDQTYLLAALEKLGPQYVGVTQLPVTVEDAELQALNAAGVRALRFNLYRAESLEVDQLESFAKRVHELVNWHVEIYADAPLIDRLSDLIGRLPAVSIDHLALSKRASKPLLKLVEQGVRVKASGFGRLESGPIALLRELYGANPECLMFGSDLPSTRAPRPFSLQDLERIGDALCESGVKRVFCDNALGFYRMPAAV